MTRAIATAGLLLLAAFSLFAMSWLDGSLYRLAMATWPRAAWIADWRLPSLVLSASAAFAWVDRRAFVAPVRLPRWLRITMVCWLLGVALTTWNTAVYTFTPSRTADVVAFFVTGLLVEELLFRGLLFDAVDAAWPRPAARLPPTVWFTAICFALSHLQFHGFAWSTAAASQVLYTMPLGLLLASLRRHTRSLWWPIGFHLANNLISVFVRHA